MDTLKRTLTIDTAASGFTKTGLARVLVLPAVVVEMLTIHIAAFDNPANPEALVFPWVRTMAR